MSDQRKRTGKAGQEFPDLLIDRLFANTIELILVLDRRGVIVQISRPVQVMLGCPADQVLGRSWRDAIEPVEPVEPNDPQGPDPGGQARDRQGKARRTTAWPPKTEVWRKMTGYLLAKTGGRIPATFSWHRCRDGRSLRWLLIGEPGPPIPEKQLPPSDPLPLHDPPLPPPIRHLTPPPAWVPSAWQQFAESLPVPVNLIAPDGTFLWANPAFLQTFLSYPPPGFNHFHDLAKFIPDFAGFLDQVRQGKTVQMPGAWVDPGLKVPGAPRVRLYLKGIMCPWLGDDHQPLGYLLITHPMAEFRRRDEELIESEERFRAVAETLETGILTIDSEGTITAANPTAGFLLGLPPERLSGLSLDRLDLHGPLGHEPEQTGHPLIEYLQAASMKNGSDTRGNGGFLLSRRTNGTDPLLLQCRWSPLRYSGMNVTAESMLTLRDVTIQHRAEQEIRQARDAAEQANTAKTHFLVMMSHELRTPLTTILGYAELLTTMAGPRNTAPPTDQPQLLGNSTLDGETAISSARFGRHIADSAKHLRSMIEGILDFACIDAGRFRLEPREVDLQVELAPVLSFGQAQAAEKGVQFRFHGLEQPIQGRSDPKALRQVLINLVANACKFTPRGAIDVTLEVSSDGIHIEVVDSGIGIAQEDLDKVFEPFYQSSAGRARRFGGLGLGLTITSRLIAEMGGTIRLDSKPGQGTHVRVHLPHL
jgi:signal transduction histidine kinase